MEHKFVEIREVEGTSKTIHFCKPCDFLCVSDITKWDRHIKTQKHINLTNPNYIDPKITNNIIVKCDVCNKHMKQGYYEKFHKLTKCYLHKTIEDTYYCNTCDKRIGKYYEKYHNNSKLHIKKLNQNI